MKKLRLAAYSLVPIVGTIALVGAHQSVPLSVVQIIPSLEQEQQAVDKVPDHVANMFANAGGDPSDTRHLGETDTFTFYGGPADDGKKMCIQIVGLGEDQGVACTSMEGFAGAGLKVGPDDQGNTVWLTPPASLPAEIKGSLDAQVEAEEYNSAQNSDTESVSAWEEQSPNFYAYTSN